MGHSYTLLLACSSADGGRHPQTPHPAVGGGGSHGTKIVVAISARGTLGARFSVQRGRGHAPLQEGRRDERKRMNHDLDLGLHNTVQLIQNQ